MDTRQLSPELKARLLEGSKTFQNPFALTARLADASGS